MIVDLSDMAQGYTDQLWKTQRALEWLQGPERGLTPETIMSARLGFVREELAPEHRRLRETIVIPYHDARNRVRSFRFRYLGEARGPGGNKYDQLAGSRGHLYGVENTQASHPILVEGEFDALMLRQCGYPAVGIPGVSSFQREWRWLFRDCDAVTVVMDGDDAGSQGADKILGALSRVVSTRRVELPRGYDVTELVVAKGPESLRELL